MPDKLTDSEIVKALECCASGEIEECKNCPYVEGYPYCDGPMERDVLDLINRLQAENERHKNNCENCGAKTRMCIESLQNNIAKKQAEIERLKKTVDIHKGIAEDWKHEAKKLQMVIDEVDDYIHPLPFETDYDKAIKQAKAEAYKEFSKMAIDRVEKAKAKYQRLCKEQGEEMEEHMHIHFNGIIGIIRNLLKELVGEDK